MPGHARRVLVADDDLDLCFLLQLNLLAVGLEVFVTHDGTSVEAMVHQHQPDVVVLDVMMPGRDGIEVLRSLKAEPSTAALPVVLLTALAHDEQVWEGWQAGADYYMTKPFRFDDLASFIGRLEGPEADVLVP